MTGTLTSPTDLTAPLAAELPAAAFADRVLAAALGAMETHQLIAGDRLGWYRALAEEGPLTSAELASRTETAERYAREWLEAQAAHGWLTVDDAAAEPRARRYTLPAGHAEVLTDVTSLLHLAPMARMIGASLEQLGPTLAAYRSGGGVSWEQFGPMMREGQAAMNRPLFLRSLTQELLPQVPELDARLRDDARVADVGTGEGWSAVGLALGYPSATVDGFDVDEPSVAAARRHAAQAGVGDRLSFTAVDGRSVPVAVDGVQSHDVRRWTRRWPGGYDVVFAFECVHDMPDPVRVLAGMRQLAAADGWVVVMDELTEESFTPRAGAWERMLYGFSLTVCLLDGMAHAPSAGTGTVIRPATMAGYAREAGFSRTEILPIEHDAFRFYRLHL